jgi:S-adenosylmethionine hydrolase
MITLLTDFGGKDPFVGIMKGVILGICPDAVVVDLCHEVPAHDILGGSFLLGTATPAFPVGTIHVAVVDPGVGGVRRPILAEVDHQVFVAPDNGLLSYPFASARRRRVRHLTAPAYWRHPVSASFHGRDIFAPVAGHLAAGVDPSRCGPEIDDPVCLETPRPKLVAPGTLQGTILWVDRFGNCITNIAEGDVALLAPVTAPEIRVSAGGRLLGRLVGCFGEVERGETGALFGSAGYVELFGNREHLARRWNLTPGDPVLLQRASG